jgi:O-acetyl-ADP-ribose deacetylase (regulator of RNase III)
MGMIEFRSGDITSVPDVDAIVNAANSELRPGSGVCGAIFKAAGVQKLSGLVNKLHPHGCQTGSAVVTPAGDLPYKGIIHAVGPIYGLTPPEMAAQLLFHTHVAVFQRCYESKFHSVAIPAISTGVYGYPTEEAAYIAVHAALRQTAQQQGLKIVFVLWPDKLPIYQKAFNMLKRLNEIS